MSKLPLYDLEGARLDTVEWVGQTNHIVPYLNPEGLWGRRVFVFKVRPRPGFYQEEPTTWSLPPCRRCGKPADHPIHIKDEDEVPTNGV